MTLTLKNGSCAWDEQANLLAFNLGPRAFIPSVRYTCFNIAEKPVEWALDSRAVGALLYRAVPVSSARAERIESTETLYGFSRDCALAIGARGNETALNVAPDDLSKRVSFTFSVPDDARFHLAEYYHTGHLLDKSMPEEYWYEDGLKYNLMVIELDNMALRLRLEDENLASMRVRVWRHADLFSLTVSWPAKVDLLIGAFEGYDAAMADFTHWLTDVRKVRPLRDRPEVPGWINDIKFVVTADMMRSNREISHDFKDVVGLAREIKKHRDPKQVLLYIPGWQGAYDSGHPGYRPAPELGGEQGFGEMVKALHDWGFKLMIHTTSYGIDPYVDDVDTWEKAMTRDQNGKIIGWQLQPMTEVETLVDMGFRTGRIPLTSFSGQKAFSVPLGRIPGDCQAYVTVGGFKGAGRVRVFCDHRPLLTPENWFTEHDVFDCVYPLFLQNGETELEITLTGDLAEDLSGAWVQLRSCLATSSPLRTFTIPITVGSQDNAMFLKVNAENIARVVHDYGIDAVHVDASGFYKPYRQDKIYRAIREALGPDCLMACEFFATWEEFDFQCLGQNATQSIVLNQIPKMCVKDSGSSIPMMLGVKEFYKWLDQASPICDFTREFMRFYPHLCAAQAFVPVGKVCNVLKKRKIPLCDSELWDMLNDAKRLNFIPGLRVNFRDYGLDEQSGLALERINI